jgi:hypothetical protein
MIYHLFDNIFFSFFNDVIRKTVVSKNLWMSINDFTYSSLAGLVP